MLDRLLAGWLLLVSTAAVDADELRLDARRLFDTSVTRDVRLSPAHGMIELQRGALIEDDGPAAGYSYKPNEEKLRPGVWIKKDFIVADPRAERATLLVGPGGNLQFVINGQSRTLEADPQGSQPWQAFALPAELLRAGKNEVIIHGTGKVWIARADEFAAGSRTRSHHPNRSARSVDAGKSWDDAHLGTGGDIDGEYCVRLFLDRYRSEGTLLLPVLDVGNLKGDSIAPSLTTPGPVHITAKGVAGPSGRIKIHVRSGPSYVPDAKAWSVWQPLPADGVLDQPQGRFLQVRLELATDNPLVSPRLESLIVAATPRTSGDWRTRLRVVKSHNETIVRTSIPFEYEPFDQPRLAQLRRDYRLDDVARGSSGEFELITRLAAWSAARFQRGHLAQAYPPWDALEILKPHADGTPVGGFCQQYNLVLLQACESFGIPGRAVSLGPGDQRARIRSGHEVVELWSKEHRKWVHVDGQNAWYFTDTAGGAPLSLRELRERQLALFRGQPSTVACVQLVETKNRWQGLDAFPPFVELRLIPRSNFLQEKAPLPLNQGMRGWSWTGHHVWTDDLAPAALIYGERISSRSNWDWTLNQAQFYLEATAPGTLRVHLDTETPGFDTYLADIDGKGQRPVHSTFLWSLHEGRNRLEVCPRNRAGRAGIMSVVEIEYAGDS